MKSVHKDNDNHDQFFYKLNITFNSFKHNSLFYYKDYDHQWILLGTISDDKNREHLIEIS